MRGAVITEAGQTPAVQDVDEPTAGEGQAVVEVSAAGVNPVDLMIASGGFGTLDLPSVVGREGIGRLDGRRVYFNAVSPDGSFAERAVTVPDQTFDVPDGLDDADAVALGIAGLAGWLPLSHHAGVTGGERVLVLGATGIAGSVAVQGAKLLGASHVVAAGRHRETLEPLRDRGADATAILEGDLEQALAADAGEGYDVVVDCVFGAPLVAALSATATGATLVVVGPKAGTESPVPFAPLQGRTIVGHKNDLVPVDVRREAFATMAGHVLAGRLGVPTRTYALDDVADAWRAQDEGPHAKLVLVP